VPTAVPFCPTKRDPGADCAVLSLIQPEADSGGFFA
jgi:hypothetical protein